MRLSFHCVALIGCLSVCECFLFTGGSDDDDFGPESACRGCDAGNRFELDPTCELSGELDVRLGDGADSLSPFGGEEGGKPMTHSGPQGGEHSFISVQVGGINPDRYDRVELTLTKLSYCPIDDDSCVPEPIGNDSMVLGGDPAWRLVDGKVEEYGIRMFFDDEGSLEAKVLDPCGREGFATYRWSGI